MNRLTDISTGRTTGTNRRPGFPLSYQGGIAEYGWNAAGLLNKDSARGITGISYNWNGQPTKIDFTDKGYMAYSYASTGALRKVETYAMLTGKRATKVSERTYCGDFVFEGDSLLYANFAGGYFDGAGQPHYRHADFQGNIAMVTDADGQIEQHTGYYPYGEPWREPAGQPYLYGGKERMRDHALNDYDFGPRRLSSALCLWTAPDPNAVKYARLSPYAYCGGNPIRYIDPTGCDTVAVNEDGTFNVVTPTDDPFDVLVGRNGATKQVEKGFIEPAYSSQHTTTDLDGEEQELETSIYNGASATKETFEFLAQNTSVEWSIFYGKDEILIGTSHYKNGDDSPNIINNFYNDFLQGIQRFDHSHTEESHASPADVGVAVDFEKINPNVELNVFYTPTGEYLRYTQDRVEMKEVVVEAPAPDKLPFMAPLPVASRPVFQFKLR